MNYDEQPKRNILRIPHYNDLCNTHAVANHGWPAVAVYATSTNLCGILMLINKYFKILFLFLLLTAALSMLVMYL